MIIFEEDWNKYPYAIADVKTTNESFLRYAALLKAMGVKNHMFHLSLLNPDLQGVDPHAEGLSRETKAAIAKECKLNFWYFIREVFRIPPVSGVKPIRFRANRGNIAAYFLYFNHITYIQVQIRQTGKSVGTDGLMTWLSGMGTAGATINVLTLNDTLRTENLARLKKMFELLPDYLNLRTNKDIGNTEKITVDALGNTYIGHVPSMSEKQAEMKGRGLTAATNQCDEFALIPNVGITVPAMLNSGGAARELAEENREPYGTILTTTAGKRDDPEGAFAYNFIETATIWNEKLFDCGSQKRLEEVVRASNPTRLPHVNLSMNHSQLGYSDDWLAKRIEASLSKGEGGNIDRDLFNIWTFGNDAHPLDKELLKAMRDGQKTDHDAEIAEEGYITRWYIPQEQAMERIRRTHVVAAFDTSDASGGDDISFILLDIQTGEVIAAGSYNETNIILFSHWVTSWFLKYENLTGIIERKSTGSSVIDYLLLHLVAAGIDPFKRLFNWIVNSPAEHKKQWEEYQIPFARRPRDVYERNKKYFGFATSGGGATSRTALYSITLRGAAKNIGPLMYDKKLIDQVSGLINKNGRIDHRPGEHDDMVIAWLLSYWFITSASNLSQYGIDSSKIFRSNPVIKVGDGDKAKAYAAKQQEEYRRKIKDIYEEMKETDNEYIMYKLEMELRDLNSRLILQDGERFSVDDLIRSIGENKKVKRIQKRDNYRAGNVNGVGQVTRSGEYGSVFSNLRNRR